MTQTLEQLSAAATELLPCPFCGEAASFYHIAGSYGYYSSKTGVQCGNGDCLVQPKIAFDDEGYDWGKRTHIPLGSKEKAIADWNTRTGQLVEVQPDDATVERVDTTNPAPYRCKHSCERDALKDLNHAQAAEIERLREVLRAFTDCARYDPHMDGSSSFMGWRHSELRRVEELARATLAALENKP